MPRIFLSAFLVLAIFGWTSADPAQAAIVAAPLGAANLAAPAQYYAFDNEDYCWYEQGWRGPGWYICGDQWDNGFGWGGPFGWNGWGGGPNIVRQTHRRGVGIWRAEPPHRAHFGHPAFHGDRNVPRADQTPPRDDRRKFAPRNDAGRSYERPAGTRLSPNPIWRSRPAERGGPLWHSPEGRNLILRNGPSPAAPPRILAAQGRALDQTPR